MIFQMNPKKFLQDNVSWIKASSAQILKIVARFMLAYIYGFSEFDFVLDEKK